jgi:hypothetical protein
MMTQHRFLATTRSGIAVDIETGWDATAQGYILVVRRTGVAANDEWDDPELFSTRRMAKSMRLPETYAPLDSILDGFGVVLPQSIRNEVVIDHLPCEMMA